MGAEIVRFAVRNLGRELPYMATTTASTSRARKEQPPVPELGRIFLPRIRYSQRHRLGGLHLHGLTHHGLGKPQGPDSIIGRLNGPIQAVQAESSSSFGPLTGPWIHGSKSPSFSALAPGVDVLPSKDAKRCGWGCWRLLSGEIGKAFSGKSWW